ncbi:uncharacterized protein LOC129320249 isoform X2 [Prosopis cineraria]|uniref:uncharacterized protein LOC129300814 isoform X2 n=1 Tax=Prosopis cineraria TaxID=364024 RepID=UPI0024101DE5|nr:uncharacterized protein LOC129300814 isoform X2 [Prosopis cineraria]XP_054821567.1 uncharacterized protein LOC129320249 isoform X2 [Prosopis cineraria]
MLPSFISIISPSHYPTNPTSSFLPFTSSFNSSMAHRPIHHRRNLAAPPSSSMDSTPTTSFTSAPSHYCPSPKPDLTLPSKPSSLLHHFSSLNLNHNRPHHPQPLPSYLDSHLQVKSLTSSAILRSSKTYHAKRAPKLPKECKPSKKTSKEKPQKSTHELERREVQGLVKNDKVDDCCAGLNGRGPFGDEVKRPSVSLAISRGRRRSFCGSQIHAVDCARKTFDSMEKFTSKTLALALKKEFDGAYGPAWHCIVGTSFGSFVTHSVGGFLYFSMDQKLYVLLFKTTVQKAD